MTLEENLKKIDDYFANVSKEQFEKDLNDIGIDELIKYVEKDKKIKDKEIYFSETQQYTYTQEINYNILYKEGTRCQTKRLKQTTKNQEMALAS